MKRHKKYALLTLATGLLFTPLLWADHKTANCEVTRDGQPKHKESGLCSFSERPGYVDFELRTGKIINLTPGKNDNHFKDKKGQMVVREGVNKGKGQKYKWDHKKIVVTFSDSISNKDH